MIKRFLALALAMVFASCCAPAMAAVTNPACSNLPVVNGSTTYNECSYSNSTNIWLEHMDWGWDYTGLAPHPFAVDPATGDQIVNVYSLPSVTVGSSVLPTGAATSALQTSTAASIVQALGTPLQAGGSVAVTASALPTGAATSAAQTAAQTSLTAIASSTAAGATAALQSSIGATAHADATAIQTAAGTTATTANGVQGVTGGVAIDTVVKGTAVDRGGTITTASAAQTFAAANTARRGLHIQNQSTGALYFNCSATATLDYHSMQIPAGSYYETSNVFVGTGACSIIGATAGQAFYAREF